MGNKKIITILLILGVYALSSGISYALFSNNIAAKSVVKPSIPTANKNGGLAFDNNLPKTEACPLNGKLYSKQQKQWWEQHRPLGVMIENHEDARPQSGLSSADVIYEAVAEGSITRFLSIFYCQDVNPIGPVRSARTYFLDFVSEYGDYPLYTHVGGANTSGPADALSQIEDYGWGSYNDLSQFSIGFPTFWRDDSRQGHPVATEHTMYSTTAKLWDIAKSRGLAQVDKKGQAWDTNFVPYTFKEDVVSSERGTAKSLHLEFWPAYKQYAVDWIYDKVNNIYNRNNAGVPHVDKDTGRQLNAKNIVILYMQERHANDGYEDNAHLLYQTKGTGKAVVYMDGKKIAATWRKTSRTSRTLLFDTNGNGIKFNRGVIWFEILPTTGVLEEK